MKANNESLERGPNDSLLPISFEAWQPRGGAVWLVSGVCALALALFMYLKLDDAAARASSEAGEQAAQSERTEVEPVAPAAASSAADLHTDAQPSTPPPTVKSETQPEVPSVTPPDATTPSVDATQPKVARKSKPSRAELQRLGHPYTLALNLGHPIEPEAVQSADSSVAPQTPGPAEAPSEVSPPPTAPAPKPAIPDNPY